MRTILIWGIRLYRYIFSVICFGCCRFYPTCSQYALQAIEEKGATRGSWLACCRICRCHPLAPGGYDPVP